MVITYITQFTIVVFRICLLISFTYFCVDTLSRNARYPTNYSASSIEESDVAESSEVGGNKALNLNLFFEKININFIFIFEK